MNSYTLSNNVSIPELGFGTWQTPNGDVAVSAVKKALEVGYRHIDTAQGYKNEDSVGQAIKESGIPREEIFLTTKLWNENHSYDLVLSSFEESLKKLQTDYIDLFLIHWPNPVKFRDKCRDMARDGRALSSWEDQSHRRQQFLASSFRRTEKNSHYFPNGQPDFLSAW